MDSLVFFFAFLAALFSLKVRFGCFLASLLRWRAFVMVWAPDGLRSRFSRFSRFQHFNAT